MRKPDVCICENKDADQLCSNCTADQRLCFRCIDSIIPLLSKSMPVQPSLCQTLAETQKTGFLMMRLSNAAAMFVLVSVCIGPSG